MATCDFSAERIARFPRQSDSVAGSRKIALAFLLAALLLGVSMQGQAFTLDAQNIDDFSLEDLATIRVTSVSKRSELLAEAPASIYVITGNDIRRSSATTLPEALRLAPNLQVARSNARNYAISARGFNGIFENKLLVLIDGRTVYSPLFSGVFWDAQDVVLEDIDRIEVISGPGATLWGANAVNGVINIITKPAANTQGALASVGASRNEKNGSVRYGGSLDNGGHYRVYGKYADNDDLMRANDVRDQFGWKRHQTGFRTDWTNTGRNFTVQGDAYEGKLHQAGTRDITIAGANLLGRMNTRLNDGSTLSLQAYWDFTERNQPLAFIEHLNTFDVQLQHSIQANDAHNIVWGGGYRHARDRVENGPGFAFLPGALNLYWGNLFIQDEITLLDNLRLTAGVKYERNNYTGDEFLPTLRMAWTPLKDHLVWSSYSRSVRAPSRIDRDFFAIPGILGGPEFKSEIADVFELGYRVQPTPSISYSTTAFYSRYDRLRTLSPNPDGPGSVVFRNDGDAKIHGIEMWGNWQALLDWRLSAGAVVQRVSASSEPGTAGVFGEYAGKTNDPTHYWMLRSTYDIAQDKELDVTVRHVGRLSQSNVPSYTAVDMRFGWKLSKELELSLIGQNLFDPKHGEFDTADARIEYERAAFLKLVWRQ
jgi:iron complex outermembrane recepter protein